MHSGPVSPEPVSASCPCVFIGLPRGGFQPREPLFAPGHSTPWPFSLLVLGQPHRATVVRQLHAGHLVEGEPLVIKETGSFIYEEIDILGVPSYHDKCSGGDRGDNIIYKIIAGGINLVHLGDLGHILTDEQIEAIGTTDVLLLPVGGNYTVNADEAYEIAQQLKPKIIIPMHFKTPVNNFDIDPAEAFTAKFERFIKKPFLQINQSELDYPVQVIVLDYPVE